MSAARQLPLVPLADLARAWRDARERLWEALRRQRNGSGSDLDVALCVRAAARAWAEYDDAVRRARRA